MFLLGTLLSAYAQVPTYVPSNGLVGWYPFSGNANDQSGNGNNGTVTGATLTTDRFGNSNTSYSFNGTSNYITATLTSSLNTNNINGITLSAWCNLNSLTTVSSILNIFDASTLKTYGIKYDGPTSPVFNGVNGIDGSPATMSLNGIDNPTINKWYNVVLTCDYSNNSSKLFVNGILQRQSTVVLNRPVLTTVRIGAWVPLNGNWVCNGKLDDIGVWNRALTQQEITNLYNGNICYKSISVTDTLIINVKRTSLNPLAYTNTIKVYPNPTKDKITIDNGDLTKMTGYSIKIYNSIGQQLFQSNITQQQFSLDITQWGGNGLYFMELKDNNGNIIDIKKIVLQ